MITLAQGSANVQDQFAETIIYAILCAFALVILFIIAKFIKSRTAQKIRNMETPFAMTPSDLQRMKEEGQLTQEEVDKIKRTMARGMLERAEQEQRIRDSAPKDLNFKPTLNDQIREKSIRELAERNARAQASAPPSPAPIKPIPAPATPKSQLPDHLAQHLNRDQLELEELVNMGFLTNKELSLIEAARKSGG